MYIQTDKTLSESIIHFIQKAVFIPILNAKISAVQGLIWPPKEKKQARTAVSEQKLYICINLVQLFS